MKMPVRLEPRDRLVETPRGRSPTACVARGGPGGQEVQLKVLRPRSEAEAAVHVQEAQTAARILGSSPSRGSGRRQHPYPSGRRRPAAASAAPPFRRAPPARGRQLPWSGRRHGGKTRVSRRREAERRNQASADEAVRGPSVGQDGDTPVPCRAARKPGRRGLTVGSGRDHVQGSRSTQPAVPARPRPARRRSRRSDLRPAPPRDSQPARMHPTNPSTHQPYRGQ